MTTKQNAVDLARTARSEAACIVKGDKRTIAAIITNWNECVKQAGFMGIYDFPTTGYSRKAQIVTDLLRCADQLDNYSEPKPHAPQTVEQQIRVLDVEEALAEALEMNITTKHAMAYLHQQEFVYMSADDKAMAISRDHTEALMIDAEYKPTPVTCSIFQRNDGIQLALDNSCDVRFIRTRKNGEWFKAGFRDADMEVYQHVQDHVLFTVMPSRTMSFADGMMVISEG